MELVQLFLVTQEQGTLGFNAQCQYKDDHHLKNAVGKGYGLLLGFALVFPRVGKTSLSS